MRMPIITGIIMARIMVRGSEEAEGVVRSGLEGVVGSGEGNMHSRRDCSSSERYSPMDICQSSIVKRERGVDGWRGAWVGGFDRTLTFTAALFCPSNITSESQGAVQLILSCVTEIPYQCARISGASLSGTQH